MKRKFFLFIIFIFIVINLKLIAFPSYGSNKFFKYLKEEIKITNEIYSKLPYSWNPFKKRLVFYEVKKKVYEYLLFFYKKIAKINKKIEKKDIILLFKEKIEKIKFRKALIFINKTVNEYKSTHKIIKSFFCPPILSCIYNIDPNCFELSIMIESLIKLKSPFSSTISTIVYPSSLVFHAVTLVKKNKNSLWYVLDINFPNKIILLKEKIGYNYMGFNNLYKARIYPYMELYIKLKNTKNIEYKWVSSLKNVEKIYPLTEDIEKGEIYLQYLEKIINNILIFYEKNKKIFIILYKALHKYIKKFYFKYKKNILNKKQNFYYFYNKGNFYLIKYLYYKIINNKKEKEYLKKVLKYYNKSIKLLSNTSSILRLIFVLLWNKKYVEILEILRKYKNKRLFLYLRLFLVSILIDLSKYKEAKKIYKKIQKNIRRDLRHVILTTQDIIFIRNTLKKVKKILHLKIINIDKLVKFRRDNI